jgi:Methyltransferase domain
MTLDLERLNRLDVSLFAAIESQTSPQDRRSLLALHGATADSLGTFDYLEIGSHKGGSLQVLVADERCRKIVSIDPRPEWQPDDRPGMTGFTYSGNSTEEMLELLAEVPGADVAKIETIELGTESIDPETVERPDLCFVDGEHTPAAAFRDARFCRAVLRGRGVIAFHDFWIVAPAVLRFLRETPGARGFFLRNSVFVVELGGATILADPRIQSQARVRPAVWRLLASLGAGPLVLRAFRFRARLRERMLRVRPRRRKV